MSLWINEPRICNPGKVYTRITKLSVAQDLEQVLCWHEALTSFAPRVMRSQKWLRDLPHERNLTTRSPEKCLPVQGYGGCENPTAKPTVLYSGEPLLPQEGAERPGYSGCEHPIPKSAVLLEHHCLPERRQRGLDALPL